MAVLSRTDVAGRVERQAAERAGRPPGRDNLFGTPYECPRLRRGDADAQHVRPVFAVGERLRGGSLLAFGGGVRLDDDAVVVSVPGESERADPELLHQRCVERRGVDEVRGCRRRDVGLVAESAAYLVEEFGQALGQGGDLDLLQRDTRHPAALARLQEEGALARLPDGAGHEPVGRVEEVDLAWHRSTLRWLAAGAAAHDRVGVSLAPTTS